MASKGAATKITIPAPVIAAPSVRANVAHTSDKGAAGVVNLLTVIVPTTPMKWG